jgi:hypothetical protein
MSFWNNGFWQQTWAPGGWADALEVGLPVIKGVSPDTGASHTDGVTRAGRFAISGTAPAGETVVVYRDGTSVGVTQADSHGDWTLKPKGGDLPDGTYQFTAISVAADGTISDPSMPFKVTVDTTPPPAPTIVGATASAIAGTAEPGSTVIISAVGADRPLGTAKAGADGSWAFTPPAVKRAPGHSRVVARAVDPAGNVSRASAPASVSESTAPTSPAAIGLLADLGVAHLGHPNGRAAHAHPNGRAAHAHRPR